MKLPSILTLDDLRPADPHGLWQERPSGLYVPSRPRSRRTLRVADLFCGCGGFSLGMQQAGLDVVAAVEWEPNAILTYLSNLGSRGGCAMAYVDDSDKARLAKVLKKHKESRTSGWIGRHNPRRDGSGCRAMVMGDATKVTGDTVRDTLAAVGEPGTIDVVVGGPPCQGMSRAGRQRPDDPRNNLVLEFVRIADELGADVFVMENVPPLVTQAKYRPLFDELVARANAAGFSVVANVIDAANYGVPQLRRRAILVGTRGEADERPFTFPMPATWAFGATATGKRWSFLDGDAVFDGFDPEDGVDEDDDGGEEDEAEPAAADEAADPGEQLDLFGRPR